MRTSFNAPARACPDTLPHEQATRSHHNVFLRAFGFSSPQATLELTTHSPTPLDSPRRYAPMEPSKPSPKPQNTTSDNVDYVRFEWWFFQGFWRFLGYPGFRLRPDNCPTASLESSTEKPFTANQNRTRKLGNARRLKTSPARNTDQMSVFETSQSDGPRLRQAFSSRLFVLGGNL